MTLALPALIGSLQDRYEKAVQNGFGHREWLENDTDLNALRGNPRFEALRRKL